MSKYPVHNFNFYFGLQIAGNLFSHHWSSPSHLGQRGNSAELTGSVSLPWCLRVLLSQWGKRKRKWQGEEPHWGYWKQSREKWLVSPTQSFLPEKPRFASGMQSSIPFDLGGPLKRAHNYKKALGGMRKCLGSITFGKVLVSSFHRSQFKSRIPCLEKVLYFSHFPLWTLCFSC